MNFTANLSQKFSFKLLGSIVGGVTLIGSMSFTIFQVTDISNQVENIDARTTQLVADAENNQGRIDQFVTIGRFETILRQEINLLGAFIIEATDISSFDREHAANAEVTLFKIAELERALIEIDAEGPSQDLIALSQQLSSLFLQLFEQQIVIMESICSLSWAHKVDVAACRFVQKG